MARSVTLRNGETIGVVDDRKFLECVIYDSLGRDTYQVFIEYIANLEAELEHISKEYCSLSEDYDILSEDYYNLQKGFEADNV